MVVVNVVECGEGDDRGGGGGGGGGIAAPVAPPSLVHYPAHKCPAKGDLYPSPPGYDSDSGNSEHSSSGRGSGGSDLGSEVERPYRRTVPVTHPPVDAPLCVHCCRRDLSFFNPGCAGCSGLLRRPSTTPAHLFAIMRQWVPEVQQNIHHFVRQALGLGSHVDDRDALTDMTLLHYAVKAGSNGVGDQDTALQVVKELLRAGADVHQRCRWTHMTALHYAAYFDVAPVLHLLLKDPMGVCVNDACLEYSGGTPLHIAAANLCLAAVRVLLHHGALPTLTDTQGRTPFQCIPTPEQYELVPDVQEVISCLRHLLSPSAAHAHTHASHAYPAHGTAGQGSSGKAVLKAMGLKLGDRVLVSGVKTGVLRFAGTTEFSTGLWAGVELETPTGRHNGTVKGVMYFRCAKNYGIFVPMNRLTKIPHVGGGGGGVGCGVGGGGVVRQGRSSSQAQRHHHHRRAASRRSASLPPGRVNHGRVDVSQVASKVAQDIRDTTRKIVIGDRVFVDMGLGSGSARVVTGSVRYTGAVHFASGFWVGVELDVGRGTNDGSVNGTKYFTCRPHHGIFAAPSRVIKTSGETSPSECPSELYQHDTRQSFLSHSRQSLSSHHGSSHALHLPSSGPLSLGYSSSTLNSQGPRSLGWGGTIEGSSSSTNLDVHDSCCASCSASQHLLETSGPASLKTSQTIKPAIYPANTAMTSLNRSFSARYATSRQRQEELERAAEERRQQQVWFDPPVLQATPKAERKKRENQHWLEVGHNVLYKNIVGIIKYIGRVDFEEGVWLGVELRSAKGRHDGTVRGRRYFTSKPRHGVMVRPNKVYVRGINGSKLVKPEDEDQEEDYP
ncbi:CAP-Gly domain-containing linker protein 4-like isoform X2 [Eriocheir sinensis]|uniref:CAP-Gly domain-containing linker protein 4-like isoform X2 n=1 Tax=Eriocheir sinensis TaxID=95602 RepID=UPI0021C6FDA1|nr:CAP-Gly domain-containing linker protein 4-like isoform X2 [Eriocheir sinensis]